MKYVLTKECCQNTHMHYIYIYIYIHTYTHIYISNTYMCTSACVYYVRASAVASVSFRKPDLSNVGSVIFMGDVHNSTKKSNNCQTFLFICYYFFCYSFSSFSVCFPPFWQIFLANAKGSTISRKRDNRLSDKRNVQPSLQMDGMRKTTTSRRRKVKKVISNKRNRTD